MDSLLLQILMPLPTRADIAAFFADKHDELVAKRKTMKSRMEWIDWYIAFMRQRDEQGASYGIEYPRDCKDCGCVSSDSSKRFVSHTCNTGLCRKCVDKRPDSADFVALFESADRECEICSAPSPDQRAFFTGCGHLTCAACAYQMRANKSNHSAVFSCPFCLTSSEPVILEEAYRVKVSDPRARNHSTSRCARKIVRKALGRRTSKRQFIRKL